VSVDQVTRVSVVVFIVSVLTTTVFRIRNSTQLKLIETFNKLELN